MKSLSELVRKWKHVLLVCALAGGALALVGCGGKSTNTGGPTDPETVRRVRQQIVSSDPQAIVGQVAAVEPNGRPFAAVTDVNARDFREGEPMTFIDANRKTLAQGVVRRITDDTLHVEWMKPGKGGRAPRVGDLAVRFK